MTGDGANGRTGRAQSWAGALSFLAVVAVALVVGVHVLAPHKDSASAGRPVADIDVSKLVAATTKTTLARAPRDRHPGAATDGEVVRPLRALPLYAAPGKRPFGKILPHSISDTWLPVIDRQGAWSQVLLPSRPNGSTGWLRTAAVEQRRTPYLIRVHVGSKELELLQEGASVGRWPVAVGAPETPTPTGRTFLLGSISDPDQSYSPVILPLGAHSDTLDSYGGGPGTVGIHTWPDSSVFGTAASHGCIRVPADALDQLTQVPLGTLVLIDAK
jgi:lipoprotein-anchoring transpeptidase ErfK/SrfK